MKTLTLDQPDERNLLDAMKQGTIGKPVDRVEGALKVTGTATYAAEFAGTDCLEGVLVLAAIPSGKVTDIDEAAALAMDGVRAVIRDKRMITRSAQGGAGEAPVQHIDRVDYWGQPVAMVVADTFEQARHAAEKLQVSYVADDPSGLALDPAEAEDWEEAPDTDTVRQGDLDHAMAEAAYAVDREYTTAGHNSAPMEPHAAIARWAGDCLTVHASLQMLNYNIDELADALNLEKEKVHLLSPYVGGGFGSKLGVSPEIVAASIAAMKLDRPVRCVLTRQQVFQCIMRRTETRQRVRFAADEQGRLLGFGHEAWVSNLPEEDFAEPVTQSSVFLYAGENRLMKVDMARICRMTAGSVRAPGEAVGMPVVEAAMDELAEKIGLDPVELRLRNIPERHPSDGKPYSSRKLAECLRLGAERFGWDSSQRKPCSRREGDWWIGTGMATAARIHFLSRASAKVVLLAGGGARVETDMTDIGTGTYTILAQIAGEMLGLDPAEVEVRLGNSNLAEGPGSGGSWGAASSGSAVQIACEDLRAAICDELGCEDEDLTLKDGFAITGNTRTALADILDGSDLERTGTLEPGETRDDFAQASYGAFFTEVGVNAWTGEVRVRRMTGTFGIGRVLNEKTATSQCMGGMVWCIGSALTEGLVFDVRDGHLVNHDLAEYHVPVNLDVPHLDVMLVEERDPAASPLQAKGVGELGNCGGAGAIANAIYNACGVRVRDFPMTLDRIIGELPDP